MENMVRAYSVGNVPQVEAIWLTLSPDQRGKILEHCVVDSSKHRKQLTNHGGDWYSLPKSLYKTIFGNFSELLPLGPVQQAERIIAFLTEALPA